MSDYYCSFILFARFSFWMRTCERLVLTCPGWLLAGMINCKFTKGTTAKVVGSF